METFTLKTLVALIIIFILFSGCDLSLTDISPDRSNGVSDGGNSTAGLVLNMAGDKNGLYAIGLNSGVWKTEIDNAGLFNKWRQLPQSPRYAHCIAVDPNLPDHIAVGEREGDAIDPAQNHCGLWESFDGGRTFDDKYYFNPLDHPCRHKRTQVINGVVITNKGTILISTPCGIGRKEPFAPTFTYAHFTTSQEHLTFTGIAMFKDWIVARTKTSIFISNNDGNTWNDYPIQLDFPNQSFTQDYSGDTAGNYSVAIIQLPDTGNVFVYVPVTRSPNDPNQGSCVIFNNQGQYWTFQSITERGLGVGLGGSVFVKSFFCNSSKLKSIVGGNTNLIYCAGQNLCRAKSINADGTAEWENIANGNIKDEPKPSDLHSDFWDFAIDPLGWYAWVSCDGGVYYYAMDHEQSTVDLNSDEKYLNLNSGLHTQHIHQSFVAGFSSSGQVHYGYGSQDNGGWQNAVLFGDDTRWKQIGLGDVNIVEGDQGNSQFILIGTNLKTAVMAGLDLLPPFGAKVGPIAINYGSSGSFQFIQTLASESPSPFLDAVMLTTLPLQYAKAPASETDILLTNVPTDLGSKNGTAIIRNPAFAANPDINASMGVGWSIEFDNLPAGAMAFWTSGGHVDPTYYLLCNGLSGSLATGILYKRTKSDSSWRQLTDPGNVAIIPYAAGQVQHGPVFVNPYDPTVIYVSCRDGIYSSVYTTAARGKTKGGLTFTKDVELTNLVSGSGKYPIDNTFPGGNGVYVRHSNQSNLNAMYPVSWVAFNRFKPEQIVASSPFTGVFFKDGTKKWRDLSDVLPKPFTPVSSVNINNQGIYVTTEGRGIFLITNY